MSTDTTMASSAAETSVTTGIRAMLATIPEPGGIEIADRANRQLALMKGMKIEDPTGLELARDDIKGIKSIWAQIEEQRTLRTGPLNDVLGIVNGIYQPALKTLAEAERLGKAAVGAYLDAEERKAEAARREQERLQREAEQRAAAAAAEARAKAEAQARALAEQEAALQRQAQVAMAAGDGMTAAALQQQAAETVEVAARVLDDADAAASAVELQALVSTPIAVPQVTARSVGLSSVKSWDVEVIDLAALVRYVAANPALLGYLTANLSGIKAGVKAAKGAVQIDGVKITPVRSIRA
jgi:hypothetical protein